MAAKPAAKSKPAAKAPAKKPTVASLRKTAETAEHELQTVIEDATVNGWQPVHTDRCSELAKTAAKARKQLGEAPAGHTTRFL